MPGEITFESGSGRSACHDLGQRPIRKRRPKVPMPIDPAKDAPLTERRRFEPTAEGPDWTRRFFSSQRDGDGRARALAIGLRAPDRQHDPFGLKAQVGDLERDELAAAQRRRPTYKGSRENSDYKAR